MEIKKEYLKFEDALQCGINRLTDIPVQTRAYIANTLKEKYGFEEFQYVGHGCSATVLEPKDEGIVLRLSHDHHDRPRIPEVIQEIDDFVIRNIQTSLRVELLPKGIQDVSVTEVRTLFRRAESRGWYWGAANERNAVRLPTSKKAFIADVNEMHINGTSSSPLKTFPERMETCMSNTIFGINQMISLQRPTLRWQLEEQEADIPEKYRMQFIDRLRKHSAK